MELPHVTITLTRYAEPDWLVMETLESLTRQEGVSGEVLFLDQNHESEIDFDRLENANLEFKRICIPAKSLSYARNYAIEHAENDLILYIDSDAIAEPDWAKFMAEALGRRGVAIVGGRILLKWHKTPLWITRARVVHEQYSSLDLGRETREFPKVVGASFGINRALLGNDAYFNEELGRRPGLLLGGEETDLCTRARKRSLGVLYQGKALVHHQVLPERIKYSWIFRRMYYAGKGRASAGGMPSATHEMCIWDYLVLPIVIPFYAAGYLAARAQGK
jgi:GT2 family glycosyltransferase